MFFQNNYKILLLALFSVLTLSTVVIAESSSSRTIRVVGKQDVTVTADSILLSDIAKVSSKFVRDDQEILKISKIEIGKSPSPGKPLSISASEVIEKIRATGIEPDSIGYHFPRIIKVNRASRKLSRQEIRMALEEAMREYSQDAQLVSFDYSDDVLLVPGISSLGATARPTSRPGIFDFDLTATVKEQPPVRFTVQGQVDEWREVPVASRSLQRGKRVGEGDISMARLKSVHIPVDANYEAEAIVGQEAKRNISAGEVFRNTKLAIPPIIAAGASILMRYKSDLLEATATGVALDDGLKGERIRVRNDASRRILEATVIESGLVGVER